MKSVKDECSWKPFDVSNDQVQNQVDPGIGYQTVTGPWVQTGFRISDMVYAQRRIENAKSN